MTNWKMVAEDLRKALRQHRLTCCLCKRDDRDVVLVSDRCREGGMLLSEIVIADIQAEVQAVKKMHGCAS
jgi:hypothetical protein